MADQETWAQRISEWRSSGLTSTAYCEGKPFTPGGLRHWAHRLGQVRRQGRASVRMARVVRVSAPRPSSQHEPLPIAAGSEALVVEIGAVRVALRPGFDRPTLATVLEVLVAAMKGRR